MSLDFEYPNDYLSYMKDNEINSDSGYIEFKKGIVPEKTETQVDHVKRKREGGRGNPDNGQVLCRKCNLDKH